MTLETLNFSLKEVYKAKGSLESRLNEKRLERKNIECILEKVNSKLTQVRDLHTKMTETMKMAQHKTAQLQAQSDSMEASNKEKRNSLQSINQKIKDLQEQRTEDMHTFEQELSKTAKRMVEAKNFYKEENLTKKIAESKKKYSDQLLRGEQLDEQTASVRKYLAVLEDKASPYKEDQIDKQTVMNILTEEQKSMRKQLENINEEIQCTRSRLKKQTELDK